MGWKRFQSSNWKVLGYVFLEKVTNTFCPDCLVTCGDNRLRTTIYGKPTHNNRLLDQSSDNLTSHKATTIRALARQAQLVCDSPDSLQEETNYLNNVFSKNNYNTDFVRQNTHSNTDSKTQTNFSSGHVTTATIPYIGGTSETISCILQSYNMHVAHKLMTTSRRLLTNVKDKDKLEDRQEQYTRSNATTARLLTVVKPAETIASDWLNTNQQREMVTSTVTWLSTTYRRNIKSTLTLRHILRILQTTLNDSL